VKAVKALIPHLTVNALSTDAADILIYDQIGEETDWWTGEKYGISATSFYKQLKDAEAQYNQINIRINSVGGSMIDGNAIYALLKNSTKDIKVIVEANAYSMASVLVQAAKKGNREMVSNGLLMIHEASMGTRYTMNATQMREAADSLDKFNATAITEYAAATGKAEAEIKALWFDGKDHFITAKEALEFGLIDKILNAEANAKMNFDSIPHSHSEAIQMVLNAAPAEENIIGKIVAKVRDLFMNEFSLPAKHTPMNLDAVKNILSSDAPITAEQRTEMLSVIEQHNTARFTQAEVDAAAQVAQAALQTQVEAQATTISTQAQEITALKEQLAGRVDEPVIKSNGAESSAHAEKYAWSTGRQTIYS
jgi:ATP-dependent Clp endopeptidase proteolytic subunit ClpP